MNKSYLYFSGFFMMLRSSIDSASGVRSTLVSPVVEGAEQSCLSFYYYISGKADREISGNLINSSLFK